MEEEKGNGTEKKSREREEEEEKDLKTVEGWFLYCRGEEKEKNGVWAGSGPSLNLGP